MLRVTLPALVTLEPFADLFILFRHFLSPFAVLFYILPALTRVLMLLGLGIGGWRVGDLKIDTSHDGVAWSHESRALLCNVLATGNTS